MKTLDELRKLASRHWERGDYLRDLLAGRPWSALSIALGSPGGRDLLQNFASLRAALGELQAHDDRYFRLEWETVNHRQLGEQRLPMRARFDDETGWLNFIGRKREAGAFKTHSANLLHHRPGLLPLLTAKPALVLEYAAAWPQLLSVCAWFIDHPNSGLYLRQIDLPGMDSKFIEQHQVVLTLLLDILLPRQNNTVRGVARHGFARRYGLRFEEPLIRFRLLDAKLIEMVRGLDDLSIPASQFAALRLPIKRVFITENKVNGLAFPNHPDAIVIFGLGYGLESLFGAHWLTDTDMHYWGDLDTHGYTMLARLRLHFPKLQSLLMDAATLQAHWPQHVEEKTPVTGVMPEPLTESEAQTYNRLKLPDGRYARVEQERIAYHWIKEALSNLE